MLDALDPARVTMQVSLDSGSPELHDRHRGAGAFECARAGIALLRELGFRLRVAATVDASDAAEEAGFHARLDADGIAPEDRLIRRVARAGFADRGLELTVENLWPEPALAGDGAWWHPVAIAEPAMQVASTPLPLVTVLAVIRAALNDPGRDHESSPADTRALLRRAQRAGIDPGRVCVALGLAVEVRARLLGELDATGDAATGNVSPDPPSRLPRT